MSKTKTPAATLPVLDVVNVTNEQNESLLSNNQLTSFFAAWVSRNVLATPNGAYHHLLAKCLQAAKIQCGDEFARDLAALIAANSDHRSIRVRINGTLDVLQIQGRIADHEASQAAE